MGKALDEKRPQFFLMTKLYRLPHLYIIVSVFLLNTIKSTPGKYRISISLWNDMEKINLNAEFEIE